MTIAAATVPGDVAGAAAGADDVVTNLYAALAEVRTITRPVSLAEAARTFVRMVLQPIQPPTDPTGMTPDEVEVYGARMLGKAIAGSALSRHLLQRHTHHATIRDNAILTMLGPYETVMRAWQAADDPHREAYEDGRITRAEYDALTGHAREIRNHALRKPLTQEAADRAYRKAVDRARKAVAREAVARARKEADDALEAGRIDTFAHDQALSKLAEPGAGEQLLTDADYAVITEAEARANEVRQADLLDVPYQPSDVWHMLGTSASLITYIRQHAPAPSAWPNVPNAEAVARREFPAVAAIWNAKREVDAERYAGIRALTRHPINMPNADIAAHCEESTARIAQIRSMRQ